MVNTFRINLLLKFTILIYYNIFNLKFIHLINNSMNTLFIFLIEAEYKIQTKVRIPLC